jgi:hypothetical protein
VTAAHTAADVEQAVRAVERTVEAMAAEGLV